MVVRPGAMPNTNRLVGLAGRTSATFGSAANRLVTGLARVMTRPAPTLSVSAIRPVAATPVAKCVTVAGVTAGGASAAPVGSGALSAAIGLAGAGRARWAAAGCAARQSVSASARRGAARWSGRESVCTMGHLSFPIFGTRPVQHAKV